MHKDTLQLFKDKNKNIKIAQWFEDNLSKNGPDPISNKNNFLKYIDYIDHNFITSDPKVNSVDLIKTFHFWKIFLLFLNS